MKAFSILSLVGILWGFPGTISFKKEADVANWTIIDDGVMGGRSKGYIEPTNEGILFSGTVSLENYGGFTSYKSAFGLFDLTSFKKMKIRYRSQGHDVAFQLETHKQFFRPYFKTNLPVSGDWTEIEVELGSFQQYQMGTKTGRTIIPSELEEVVRIGFITNEKRAGKFSFEVDYIRFE